MTGRTGFEAALAHSERTAEEVADAVVSAVIKNRGNLNRPVRPWLSGDGAACWPEPRGGLTKMSLRERGLDEKNSATASRLIKEAVEDGKIVPVNEGAAGKLMKYTPVVGAGGRVGEGLSSICWVDRRSLGSLGKRLHFQWLRICWELAAQGG